MKFKIDRSKWRSGGQLNIFYSPSKDRIGLGDTRLLNTEGFMCCVGQCVQQLDDTLEILEIGLPSEIESDVIPEMFITQGKDIWDGMTTRDSVLVDHAVEINDDAELTTPQREEKLKELFIEHGHEIEFFGEPVRPKNN